MIYRNIRLQPYHQYLE